MTGCVGWWPLHRTVGDAVDLSGEGNHGTVNGATRGVAGRGGLQAYSFDGTDDYTDMGNPSTLDAPDSFTITFWASPDTVHTGSCVGKWTSGYLVRAHSTPQWEFYITDGSVTNSVKAGSYSPGAWSFVCATYDGSTMELFVDATSVGTNTIGSVASNTNPFRVGDGFDGPMCDVRFYNRALSPAEVERLYEWGAGDYAEPPSDVDDADAVSYWTLDESSGDAIDQWGSNDGTVTGATQGVTGVRGTAYSFDGTDDSLNVDGAFPDTQPFTVSVWALPPDPGSVSDIRIFGHDGTRVWLGDRNKATGTNESRWNLNVYDGSNYVTASGSSRSGNWVHFVCMYDGSTVSLYENAALEGSASLGSRDDTGANDFTFGVGGPSGTYFPGDLDEIRVYSRALTPAEVHEVYRYGTRGVDMRARTVVA